MAERISIADLPMPSTTIGKQPVVPPEATQLGFARVPITRCEMLTILVQGRALRRRNRQP